MTLTRSGLTEKRTRRTMKTFKGLENIHSVIDKHIAEWRKEQGEPPAEPESISIEERVKRHLIEPEPVKPESKPRDPNRFINAEVNTETEHSEPEKLEEHENNEPEIISVIKQKEDEHHSWLYNEVLKAIKDAAGDGHNTKVIAVIVPVVQNAKEFEDLPVNETVTLSPVEEETGELASEEPTDMNIPESEPETPEEITEPEPEQPEPEPVPEEATSEPEPEPEVEPEPEISEPEPEPEAEPVEPEPEPEENSEVVIEENEEPADTITEEITEKLPEPEEAETVEDLIPEGQDEPDEEEAEAFRQMEESLDESLREKAEELAQVETEEGDDEEADIEAVVMPENSDDDEEADDLAVEIEELDPAEGGEEGEDDEEEEISAGEPMSFTEIPFEAVEEEIELQPDPEEKK